MSNIAKKSLFNLLKSLSFTDFSFTSDSSNFDLKLWIYISKFDNSYELM